MHPAQRRELTIAEACRLVQERESRIPREVEFVVLGTGWAIRAYFENITKDYRVTADGSVQSVAGGFPTWPPSRALVKRGRCGSSTAERRV